MVKLTVTSKHEHSKFWENFLDHAADVLYADPDYDETDHLTHWQRVLDWELQKHNAKGVVSGSRSWEYHELEFPDEESLTAFVLTWS